jgi:hypothetical protein
MHSKLCVALWLMLAGCGGKDGQSTYLGNDPTGKWQGPEDTQCWTSPAPSLFPNALCLCNDLGDVGALRIDPGDGQTAATFGANGTVRLINDSHVNGSFTAYKGLWAAGNVEIRDDMTSTGDIGVAGRLAVGKDLAVGGQVSGIGVLRVGGTLRAQGAVSVLGDRTVGGVGAYTAPAGPPCACSPGDRLDVQAAVEKARAANDNAARGLPTSLAQIGREELRLASGKYFFDQIGAIGYLKIIVEGTVALYLDGNLDSIGAERITLSPGATLDLYVSGSLRSVGNLIMGEKQAPASFRLYVGGSDPLMIAVGNAEYRGTIYAPTAPLTYVGRTVVRGGLFASTLNSAGLLEIGYYRPEKTAPGDKLCPGSTPSTPSTPTTPTTPAGGDPDASYADP